MISAWGVVHKMSPDSSELGTMGSGSKSKPRGKLRKKNCVQGMG